MQEGVWIAFEDSNGLGYAQPDFWIEFDSHIVLFECKLSQKTKAFPQMGLLYKPLLEHLYGKPVIGVQACKILKFIPEKYILKELQEVFVWPTTVGMFTWHAFDI